MASSATTSLDDYDPLARLLRRRLRLTPINFGLAILFADILVDGIMCWHWHLFGSSSATPGLLQDYMALTTDLLFNPVIGGIYLWLAPGSTRMFERLTASGVFKSSDAVGRAVQEQRSRLYGRWVFVLAVSVAGAFGTIQVLEYFGLVPWKTVSGYIELHPEMAFFRAPFWYFTTYATVFIGWNLFAVIKTLNQLFRENAASIQPLHLDTCGGLAAISEFTLTVGYAIGAFGFLLSAATVYDAQHDMFRGAHLLFLGLGIYVFLAPAYFFLPLAAANSAMRDSRSGRLFASRSYFVTPIAMR